MLKRTMEFSASPSSLQSCLNLCWKFLNCSSWEVLTVSAQGLMIAEELQGTPGFLQSSLCHSQESTNPKVHIALISQFSFSLEMLIFNQIRVIYRGKIWLGESVLKWSDLPHWTIHPLCPCLHHCGLSALHMWWFMMLTSSWSSLTISQKALKREGFGSAVLGQIQY